MSFDHPIFYEEIENRHSTTEPRFESKHMHHGEVSGDADTGAGPSLSVASGSFLGKQVPRDFRNTGEMGALGAGHRPQ